MYNGAADERQREERAYLLWPTSVPLAW